MMIVLCGTNRPDAVTRKVADRVMQLIERESPLGDEPVKKLDLAQLKPDLFTPEAYADTPEWFKREFQEPILKADGIVVVVPEYNGSFPGVLKYFIDMLEFPRSLVNVPVTFVGVAAGQFGALRAVEQLEMIFHYRSSHLFGSRLFISRAGDVVAEDGTVGEHEPRLNSLVKDFCRFCITLKAR